MNYDRFNAALHGEPHWRPARRRHLTGIPQAVRCWLLDPASLTHRLRQACDGPIRVQVLGQAHVRPDPSEAALLGMDRNAYALVRQVRLLCDGRPWVFARTVIPVTSALGPLRHLTGLGSKPLGAVLFGDRSMRRGEVELARLTVGHRLFATATGELSAAPDAIWGRRSVFWISGGALLVSEIFLPGLGLCGDTRRPRRRGTA